MKTKESAGPSGLDSDGWRRILLSKNFGQIGKDQRSAIATMAKHLCTRKVELECNDHNSLEAYLSCRLIPIDKSPGVGEVLRRIIGKSIIVVIKMDIIRSAGSLQLCAGQQAGCEAAVHAMSTNISRRRDRRNTSRGRGERL